MKPTPGPHPPPPPGLSSRRGPSGRRTLRDGSGMGGIATTGVAWHRERALRRHHLLRHAMPTAISVAKPHGSPPGPGTHAWAFEI